MRLPCPYKGGTILLDIQGIENLKSDLLPLD